MDSFLENKLMEATQVIEQQLDAEINRLDNMDEDELEKIRERRIAAMKKAQVQKQVDDIDTIINFLFNRLQLNNWHVLFNPGDAN